MASRESGEKCDWQQGKWVKTQKGHGSGLTMHQSTKSLYPQYSKVMLKDKTHNKLKDYKVHTLHILVYRSALLIIMAETDVVV